MKAISVRQPWAWLIVNGYKDIENRVWATTLRGEVLIHASKTFDRIGYYHLTHPMYEPISFVLPHPEDLDYGGIVGSVEIIDCVKKSPSVWFEGTYGFVLRNAKPVKFLPFSGKLGFFEVKEPPSIF